MHVLLSLPTVLALLLISVVSVALTLSALLLIRKKYAPEKLKENHEVAAIIFGAFGWLYAVIVAFVVFVTWTGYSDAGKNMQLEASEALDVFNDAAVFSPPLAGEIRGETIRYIETVAADELPRMTSENLALFSSRPLQQLKHLLNTAPKEAIGNREVYSSLLHRLDDLSDYRRLRIFAGSDSVPPLIWLVLLVGGFTTVANTFFFGMKQLTVQALMTAILTIMLAMVLFLIFVLDHPFTGTNRVSNAPLRQVLAVMKEKQAAASANR